MAKAILRNPGTGVERSARQLTRSRSVQSAVVLLPRWYSATRSVASSDAEEEPRFLSIEIDAYHELEVELDVKRGFDLPKVCDRIAAGPTPRSLPRAALSDAVDSAVDEDRWENVLQLIIDLDADGVTEASDEDIENEGLEVDADSSHPIWDQRWIGDGRALQAWSDVAGSELELIARLSPSPTLKVEVGGDVWIFESAVPSDVKATSEASSRARIVRWCRGG